MAKRFRISLSFSGDKRSFVAEMAQILASVFGKDAILYDRFHEAEFSHCDLALQLPRLYADDSDLVVAVICNDYLSKQWCGLEWRAMYQLIKQKDRQRLMLMRFDAVEPEGLYGLAGYSELNHKTPAEAAKLILERLALNEAKPRDVYTAQLKPVELSPPSAPSAPDVLAERGSLLQVLSWTPAVPQANLALPPIDLRDLFQDRLPIHPSVWSDAIPQRLAAALPAIRQLPQPLRTSLYCHLSIAWYVGALLNPKAGFQVEPLQFSQGQLVLWGLGPGQLPPGNGGWRWDCVEEGEGSDLAVVISVSKAALADARHAIPKLGLSLAAIHHASVPVPGNEAIVDARHARWLADDLILAIHGLRARLRPQRLHLFPACPVALMLLLGQQAEACGPTTVYEFAYGAPEASYSAGMASGL
jgi:hypothetical protein